MSVNVRWMVQRDLPAIVRLVADGHPRPWSEYDVHATLRRRNYIGLVAELRAHVAGVVFYKSHPHALEIINLVVDPVCRRSGVGSRLVEHLKRKLTHQGHRELVALVREDRLAAQLFLKSREFIATAVRREYYMLDAMGAASVTERLDAYEMRCRLVDALLGGMPSNRISQFFDTGRKQWQD